MKGNFSEVILTARAKTFLTQEEFAKTLGIAPSTVNRWETGRARPNLSTMKVIRAFCVEHDIQYSEVEQAWLSYNKLGGEMNGWT